jgi:hypothetical protein
MRDDDNLDPGGGPAQPPGEPPPEAAPPPSSPPEATTPPSTPPEPTPQQSAGAPLSLWERIKKALGG